MSGIIKGGLMYKFIVLIMVLVLLLPVLAACGDDDDDKTTTPAQTTPTGTTPAVSDEPVKIGVVFPYTGPMGLYGILSADPAIAMVEQYVKDKGGINVDGVLHPLKIIKQDDMGQAANSVAATTKLITSDKVSAVAFGGVIDSSQIASAEVCMDQKVPMFTWSISVHEPNEWRIGCAFPPARTWGQMTVEYAIEKFQPETAAFIVSNNEEFRQRVELMKAQLEAGGVEVVSAQYINVGTIDMSPYLTKVKYANPDVVFIDSSVPGDYNTTMIQMKGLGGWGKIRVLAGTIAPAGAIQDKAAAEGLVFWNMYLTGLTHPGATEFDRIYNEAGIKAAPATVVGSYVVLRTIVEAIEQAGSTDPEAIREYAFSGNLHWESPYGTDEASSMLTVTPQGDITNPGFMTEWKGEKIVIAE